MESGILPLHYEYKPAKLTTGPVEKLPDSLLAEIFAHLPLKDRFLLCLVSSRWSAVSRVLWTDVTFLNLNLIPAAMLGRVLTLCPMVERVTAAHRTILLEADACIPTREHVHSMRLSDVTFKMKNQQRGNEQYFVEEFFRHFPKLSELALHDHIRLSNTIRNVTATCYLQLLFLPKVTALSLRRFILTNERCSLARGMCVGAGINEMRNLECLYLYLSVDSVYGLRSLPKLREMCFFSSEQPDLDAVAAAVARGSFPELDVFMMASHEHIDSSAIGRLMKSNWPSRILVIAGRSRTVASGSTLAVDLPEAKSRAAADASQRTTPPLQIFVGGQFTERVRFSLPSSDVARLWRIDCAMPEYLASSEIAAVFKGVWLAKVIREGPQNGLLPWKRPNDVKSFYATAPLLFCK